ncbi:major tail protein with Ig-like domain [Ralstonia phage AhaGv]|nr:major tail protein with Ig-like domain [Ralstonia phage AhaGv]
MSKAYNPKTGQYEVEREQFDDLAEKRLKGQASFASQVAKIGHQQAEPPLYTGKQATNCAVCGEYKHTPLRVDHMGGYVCLTCIDKEMAQPRQRAEPVADERAAFDENWAAGVLGLGGVLSHDAKQKVALVLLGARAAQSGQRAGVADGWQLVPVEPTDAMMEAAQAEWMKGCADPTMHVWDAMLAAAQGVQHG